MISVLVIYMGGTLGMQADAQGHLVPQPLGNRFWKALPKDLVTSLDLHLHEYPQPIDSASMQPEAWFSLAHLIRAQAAQYQAFVVIQGTDTLAYTGSALAFLLQGLGKPVIVTGSQQPLEARGTDAVANLTHALRWAAHNHSMCEVGLAFGGKLLRACASTKVAARQHDAFASPNVPLLGEVLAGERYVFYAERAWRPQTLLIPACDYQQAQVVRLSVFPGMQAAWLQKALEDVDAAVLDLYGSGNGPSDADILSVLRQAQQAGKWLLARSQTWYEGLTGCPQYATGKAWQDAGVLMPAQMTLEAAMTKLHWVLAYYPQETQKQAAALESILCGEI